jgi:hypothetical protein
MTKIGWQCLHGASEPAFASPHRPDVEQPSDDELGRAITRLVSQHEGDLGVIDTIACGTRAIPALRAVLMRREPSGLYEPRRRAVDALRSLHGYDVLADYLGHSYDIPDPIEQTGEDAVINAAARALADATDDRFVPILLALTAQKPLAGVVEALGRLCRSEALPYFFKALAEDFTRPAAEAAIRTLGPLAGPALIAAARPYAPPGAQEMISSRRYRQSALALFGELGPVRPKHRAALRRLMQDQVPDIAALACRIWLADRANKEATIAIQRLIEILSVADWPLSEEIEDTLIAHFEIAHDAIDEALGGRDDGAPSEQRTEALLRILRRAGSIPQRGEVKNHART